eukprot:g23896.t1
MNPRSQLRPSSWVPNLAISLCSEVIMVFCCGTSELAIDELSIVSCSYEGILQHLHVSVSFLLIRTDPVYAKGLSMGGGCFNMFKVEAREMQYCE